MEPGILSKMEASKSLFRRCVQCPNSQPACPSCPSGQVCQFNSQSCDACASTSCVSSGSVDSGTSSSSSGSSTGAVAGGVVGGLVLIAVIVLLVWRFCIRDRRRAYRSSQIQDYNMGSEKDFGVNAASRSARQSRHSVASFASSAFTRASNIIPIAYIPGVTNRSVHSSQDLVPPVPPIPAASPTASPQLEGEDSHYFLPKDLHETYGDRQSVARNSIASTIYRNNAIVSPVPAQMGTRAKPMAVSVRSTGKNGSPGISRSNTPPNGPKTIDAQQSSIVGRRGQAKPVQIIKSSSLRKAHSPTDTDVFELDGSGRNSVVELDGSGSETASRHHHQPMETMSPNLDGGDSDDEHAAVGKRLVAPSKTVKLSQLSSSDYDINSPGVFASRDFSAEKKLDQKKSTASLNQIIEEAAMNASREPAHRGLGTEHGEDANPFSDGHAAGTP